MLADGQQPAPRQLAWAEAAAARARRRSAGTTAVAALDFRAAIHCERPELARAVSATFADLAPAGPAADAVGAGHSHEIAVVTGRAGSTALWADGVQVAGALRPGLVLPTISWLLNQGAIAHSPGLVLFHAATLCSGEAGLLLPATSGSGKSTLASALVASGLSYLSDEVGALDLHTGRVVAYPKPISLDDGSFAALATMPEPIPRAHVVDDASAPWTNLQWQVPASSVRAGAVATSCRIAAVVFPARAPAGGRTAPLRPLGRAALCARLVEHSMTVLREPQAHFAACADLARDVPGYELDVGDLTTACTVVHELLGSRSATSTVGTTATR